MEFSAKRIVQIIAALLIAIAVTQALYTGLYLSKIDIPRRWLWGLEGLLFVILSAFAGAALVEVKRYSVAWSAIAASAVLNVVQVGVGLTMFTPFRQAAQASEAVLPAAGAVVAFSFFVYNAAKILLGFAALIFGVAKARSGATIDKLLGGATALVGIVAIVANTGVMATGRGGLIPSPLAGASGVAATLLLALCLTSALRDQEA